MSKADLTRVHRAPTADKTCGRNTVMGTAEGPVPRQQAINVLTQNRMDAQRLLLILNGKLGQDAGHTTGEHRLARSRGPNHKQTELAGGRKRHAALGDFLPQHIGIVEFGLKGRLNTLGIQIMTHGIAHAASKLRQMIDKAAINARKRHMLIGPAGDKGQPHVTSQQLKRHLALDGKHRTVQAELAGDKAAIEVVTGNLPIGRQNRDGDGQIKAATGLANIAGRQIDRNARAWDLEPGGAHRAANTTA